MAGKWCVQHDVHTQRTILRNMDRRVTRITSGWWQQYDFSFPELSSEVSVFLTPFSRFYSSAHLLIHPFKDGNTPDAHGRCWDRPSQDCAGILIPSLVCAHTSAQPFRVPLLILTHTLSHMHAWALLLSHKTFLMSAYWAEPLGTNSSIPQHIKYLKRKIRHLFAQLLK